MSKVGLSIVIVVIAILSIAIFFPERKEIPIAENTGIVPPNSSQKTVVDSRMKTATEAIDAKPSASLKSQDDSNENLKPLTKDREIALVEEKYPPILIEKGFTPHEAEEITRFQIEEIKFGQVEKLSAMERSEKALRLNQEKKNRLVQSFEDLYIRGLVEFTFSDVQRCLSKRLSKISDCTQSVLDDFLRDLDLQLETGVFELNVDTIRLAGRATKKAIETCKETPERAEYQFRLVLVECETR